MSGRGGARPGAGRPPLSIAEHKRRGTFEPSRHAEREASEAGTSLPESGGPLRPWRHPDPGPSRDLRKAAIAGLGPTARAAVSIALDRCEGWQSCHLAPLRAYGSAVSQLQARQQAHASIEALTAAQRKVEDAWRRVVSASGAAARG